MSHPVLTSLVHEVSFFEATRLSLNLMLWTIEIPQQEYTRLSSGVLLLIQGEIQELRIQWPPVIGAPIPLREEFVLYLKKGSGRSLLAHPESNSWVASLEIPEAILRELLELTSTISFKLSDRIKVIYPNNFDLHLKIS